MPSANSRKKFIGWASRIFTAVGVIVGLAGIGCLGVGLAFTLTGIGAGLGIPLMLGGLVGVGVGVMTTSLSLISLWMGKKEENLPAANQASSDVPADVPTASTSSPQESHSNSRLSRVLSYIWAFFSRSTKEKGTKPVVVPQATQEITEAPNATQESNSESLPVQRPAETTPAELRRKEILGQLCPGDKSSPFLSPEAGANGVGSKTEKDASVVLSLSTIEKKQEAVAENKPPEINHDSLIRVLSLFAQSNPASEHLDRGERLMLRAIDRALCQIFAGEFKSLIEAKKEGLFCYCVDVPLSLRDVNFKMAPDSEIVPIKQYMSDIKTIMARTALVHSGSGDDLTYARFIEGMGSEIDIHKLTKNAFCRKYICDRTGFDIGFPNYLTDFNVKHPKGSLFFYHNGIPMGFFMLCKVCDRYEKLICLNRNVSCKVLLDMFYQAKKLGLFDESCFAKVYTGEFMCFDKRTFCFNCAESTKIGSAAYLYGQLLPFRDCHLNVEVFIGALEAYSNHEHFLDNITMDIGKTIKLIRGYERTAKRELKEAMLEEHPLLDMAKINDIIKKQAIKVRETSGNNIRTYPELVITETKYRWYTV